MANISIIVPVYKTEAYLTRCVESILSQSYTDFELILVDDGSPDSCPEQCDEYARTDHRVKVLHQANGGLSSARNAGIDWSFRHSRSEWLFFVDSDDYIHPKSLEVLLKAAESIGTSVSIGGYIEINGKYTDQTDVAGEAQIFSPEEIFIEKNINATIACGKLYRKKCFENVRYPVGKLHEDEFTTYKILFREKRIAYIETPFYFYYQNETSITRGNWNPKRLDLLEALKEQNEFFLKNGFSKAYQFSCFIHIYAMTKAIQSMGNQFPEYKKKIRHEMKMLFHSYKKHVDFPLENHFSAYNIMYPWRRPFYLFAHFYYCLARYSFDHIAFIRRKKKKI